MKKTQIILLLISLMASATLFSQKVNSWEKSPEDKAMGRKFKHNFYLSGGISPLLGFNSYEVNDIKRNDIDVLYFEMGARYNVFNFRDYLSVSLATYPSFIVGSGGTVYDLMASVPVGLDINLFNNSTYNNINKLGASIGGGRSFNFNFNEMFQTTYIRGVLRYNKYARKFAKKHKQKSKLINGYFGFQYSFNSSFRVNSSTLISDFSNFRILIGRTFGL